MKKFFLLCIVLIVSVEFYGCGSTPTKEEIIGTVKQIPNFKKEVFFAWVKSDSFGGAGSLLRIKETDPKISADLYSANSFIIYTTQNDEIYIAFLDHNKLPRILAIQKLK